MKTKYCPKCTLIKKLIEFKKNKTRSDGLHGICGECSRKLNKIWYVKNKQRHIDKVAKNRDVKKQWLKKLKLTLKCARCIERDPRCLDFHHIDSSQKILDVSRAVSNSWSVEKIILEISKCEVLCSNCHRKETFKNLYENL